MRRQNGGGELPGGALQLSLDFFPPIRVGEVGDFAPIEIEAVETLDQRLLFRELVGRHHYLGHKVPFGAHLRYLLYACRPERTVVGCIQFSSAAWRMAVRDTWIGWDDATRRRKLPQVVNNSRFLILPWVHVKNLASRVLSLAVRRMAADWPGRYGVEVLLVETLVDTARYSGHCYRAANWIHLGETTGRGRLGAGLEDIGSPAPRRTSNGPRSSASEPTTTSSKSRSTGPLRGNDPEMPPTMTARAIRYQRRGFRSQLLLTSLLDPSAYPAAEIAQLYHERRELELGFDEVKTHTLEREEATTLPRAVKVKMSNYELNRRKRRG